VLLQGLIEARAACVFNDFLQTGAHLGRGRAAADCLDRRWRFAALVLDQGE
jgi:hypothetical protein